MPIKRSIDCHHTRLCHKFNTYNGVFNNKISEYERRRLKNQTPAITQKILDNVANSAGVMSQFAQTMSANAEQTRFQADGVTSASAAEQLSASINEISRQVSQSSQASQTASQEAARTNQTM